MENTPPTTTTTADDMVYCYKCRTKTKNIEEEVVPKTIYKLKCKCVVCSKRKNKLMKSV